MNNIITSLCLCYFFTDAVFSQNPVLTTKEVPLYIRQSWVKTTDPIFNECLSESGVDPSEGYKSLKYVEVVNNPSLMCFYKCIAVKLNMIEATTGEFIKKEVLRQMEGATEEIFEKCNALTKNEVDLCKKCFDGYMCAVHHLLKPKLPYPHHEHEIPSEKISPADNNKPHRPNYEHYFFDEHTI
ncbi:hypothetical protein FQR65_LT03323 [Abscondita terminalis]|nr:hypothetical protein FQR65_LT03323 [Abscondita terminalis]